MPLWGRQIPYTMMKFAAFENVVNALYANVVPKPKSECNKTEQLGVSFAAGYIAGVLPPSVVFAFRPGANRCRLLLSALSALRQAAAPLPAGPLLQVCCSLR